MIRRTIPYNLFFIFGMVTNLSSFTSLCSKDLHDTLNELLSLGSQLPLENIQNFNQLERDEWVRTKAASIPASSKVLDVGAGTCRYRTFFSHCDYRTHDFVKNPEHISYGSIDYISDITAIPVEDNYFDVALCTEVLEHVPYPIEALKEIIRIIKPGGHLLITAPLGSGLHQLPYHYYGGYTPEWYKKFLGDFHVKIVEITENGGFFKHLAQESSRVAWTFDQHKNLHGTSADFVFWLFNEFLPRYLYELDNKHFIKEFTVGYHIDAVKECSSLPQSWHAIDFEEFLIKSWQPGYGYQPFYTDPLWHLYVTLYTRNMPFKSANTPKIPKIIHQIWLGSEFPEQFKKLQKSWIEKHPEWQYKLWTDKEVESFEFDNKDLYTSATNFGEKSDILRYELLYRYGGLYIDVDFECIKPFDILHESFSFFTGLPGWRGPHLANGLIACAPGHPIIKECVVALRNSYKTPAARDDGNFGIFDRSGPFYFTECFKRIAPTIPDGTVVLPGTYFYPLPPLDARAERRPDIASFWIQPESFCVHYWSSSWLKQW